MNIAEECQENISEVVLVLQECYWNTNGFPHRGFLEILWKFQGNFCLALISTADFCTLQVILLNFRSVSACGVNICKDFCKFLPNVVVVQMCSKR